MKADPAPLFENGAGFRVVHEADGVRNTGIDTVQNNLPPIEDDFTRCFQRRGICEPDLDMIVDDFGGDKACQRFKGHFPPGNTVEIREARHTPGAVAAHFRNTSV